jgi:hypothetical protein
MPCPARAYKGVRRIDGESVARCDGGESVVIGLEFIASGFWSWIVSRWCVARVPRTAPPCTTHPKPLTTSHAPSTKSKRRTTHDTVPTRGKRFKPTQA